MALENVGSFQYGTWCMKDIRKNESGPEKKMRALNFLIPGPKWPLKLLAYFDLYTYNPQDSILYIFLQHWHS